MLFHQHLKVLIAAFGAIFVLSCAAGWTAAAGNPQTGVRLGMDIESDRTFRSIEAQATLPFAWQLPPPSADLLALQWEASLGLLRGEGKTAAMIKVAPQLSHRLFHTPAVIVLSSGPTLLSRGRFGDFDLGGHLHFTSGIGVQCDLPRDWVVGCRLQHLSNASIRKTNPGLNLVTVEFARRL